ncbi:hypothetical protein JQK19_20690 [Chromobacterium violaceum]|uniref:hypothetical protein n=1 Tax=Chromobacterium violaceum TaxID=536 RepID=UPI001BEC6763|nr:hypothetical protein [Chromobacterium violaceum]MBT2869651.1 hypothetical protein [Chromobacterium violaceum]
MSHHSLTEISHAIAGYCSRFFNREETQPELWTTALNSRQRLGLAANAEHRQLALLAGCQTDDDAVQERLAEALLHRTFDTRLGEALVGAQHPELGHALARPLAARDEADRIAEQAGFLLEMLDDLSQGRPSKAPPLSGQRTDYGNRRIAQQQFSALAESCGVFNLPADSRQFNLLLGNLPGRATLHPDSRHVQVDFFLYDGAGLFGPMRRAVIQSALQINQAGLIGRPFFIGLDSRHFLAGGCRIALDGLDAGQWLDALLYLNTQSLNCRELFRTLALEYTEFGFQPAEAADTQRRAYL